MAEGSAAAAATPAPAPAAKAASAGPSAAIQASIAASVAAGGPPVPADYAVQWVQRRNSPDEDPYYYNRLGFRFRSFAEINRYLANAKDAPSARTERNAETYSRICSLAPLSLTVRCDSVDSEWVPQGRDYRGKRGASKSAIVPDGLAGVKRKLRSDESKGAKRGRRGSKDEDSDLDDRDGPMATADMVAHYGVPATPELHLLPAAGVGAGAGASTTSSATSGAAAGSASATPTLSLLQRDEPLGTFAVHAILGSDLRTLMPTSLHMYKRAGVDLLRECFVKTWKTFTTMHAEHEAYRAAVGVRLPGLMIMVLRAVDATPLSATLSELLNAKARAGYVATDSANHEVYIVPAGSPLMAELDPLIDSCGVTAESKAELLSSAAFVCAVALHNVAGANLLVNPPSNPAMLPSVAAAGAGAKADGDDDVTKGEVAAAAGDGEGESTADGDD